MNRGHSSFLLKEMLKRDDEHLKRYVDDKKARIEATQPLLKVFSDKSLEDLYKYRYSLFRQIEHAEYVIKNRKALEIIYE